MWASSNLGADAFLLVYDVTSRDSLEALQYFNDLIDMETETRLDNADRARRAGLSHIPDRVVPPVKLIAGNKCDLQESRQVTAAVGLDWARKRGCGFMETSARNEVNIEETFALVVRRVVERRKLAEMGVLEPAGHHNTNATGMTKPLTPLSGHPGSAGYDEKRGPGLRGPTFDGKLGRGQVGGFLKKLRCW